MYVRLKMKRDSLKIYQTLLYFNWDAQNVVYQTSREARPQNNLKPTDDRANISIKPPLRHKTQKIMHFPRVGSVLKCSVAGLILGLLFRKITFHLIFLTRQTTIFYKKIGLSLQHKIL